MAETFAELLRALREARSLSQEELAARAGITAKAVGALERGERRRPYPHTVRAIADALDLPEPERLRLVASVPGRGTEPVDAAASPVSTTTYAGRPDLLIGRDEELAKVSELVRGGRRRLVTLTGPGGVGKTSLALTVLAQLAGDFPAATLVTELAAVRDPALVLPRIATVLGVPETSHAPTVAALAPFLAGRRTLLLLDNLEQLPGAAPVVAELVAGCPDLVVLVTSRAPLRVRAEHEVPLRPLAVPDHDSPDAVAGSAAGALFLDRAEAAGSPIELTPSTAAAVAALCRRLDGLPLALELVAAGARVLTPARLLEGLDRGSPVPGPRDLPERHSTMAETIGWSHDLLRPEERDLFADLAVFEGGFSLDSVGPVTGNDSLGDLVALVEQSLVMRVGSTDDVPRFRLLEPVRQFAAGRRATGSRAPDRHARHFHARSLAARAALHGPRIVGLLDRWDADHANVGAAYHRLLETGLVDEAAVLVGNLWLQLALRGHAREGLAWLDRLGDEVSDTRSTCVGLVGRAGLLFATGDIARMRESAEAAFRLATELSDDALGAEAATLAGHAAVFAGDTGVAERLLDQAQASALRASDPWAHAHAVLAEGQLALQAGDVETADRTLGSAEDLARTLGNEFTLATALNTRAALAVVRGDHQVAARQLGEATELGLEARTSWTLSYSLPALAGVAVRLGEHTTAARLFGASAALVVSDAVDPQFPVTQALADQDFIAVRRQLGDDEFRSAWESGRSLGAADLGTIAADLRRRALG